MRVVNKFFRKKKPFHFKTKFFYQTKIDLWNYNFKSRFFYKKKWGFIQRQKSFPSFTFIPLFPKEGRQMQLPLKKKFLRKLLLRKAIRLKFARLKNKELYNYFKRSRDYKDLIIHLASRLDVNLYKFFSPTSIFFIRQLFSHGKILLNNRVVQSPSVRLKKFDIISFKLNDIPLNDGIRSTQWSKIEDSDIYNMLNLRYVVNCFLLFSNYKSLDEDIQVKIADEFGSAFFERSGGIIADREFFSHYLKTVAGSSDKVSVKENKNLIKSDNIKFNKNLGDFLDLSIAKYKKQVFIKQILNIKGKVFFSNFNEKNFFFNDSMSLDHFEVIINDLNVDLIFLGFSRKDVYIMDEGVRRLNMLY